MIPCKNCILLAICKAKILSYPKLHRNVLFSISILGCSLLKTYLQSGENKNLYSYIKTHGVFYFLTSISSLDMKSDTCTKGSNKKEKK